MSEFLAEARVLVRPDTTKFRTELQAQLLAASKGVVIPVSVVPTATGAGAASLASGLRTLDVTQENVRRSSALVTGGLEELNRQAKTTTSSLLGAGSATAKLDAALLGLRTAIGSSAVIGLGATALAAIAVGKALRASITNFSDFERELNTFQAVAEATAEEMRAVRDEAALLGRDASLPSVSASDAAIAMTELAKAGLSVQESMAGARGVLELATAAQISNADAAQIAANALNSFGLEGDQAIRVADALANAANAAQGSITDFGLALRQSSAVSRQVGLSLEDTTALLSLFAKNGLQGSDAGTALRTALIRLINPTKQASAEIRKLELDLRDASGAIRADIFAQFGEATRNLTPAARDAAAAIIFGTDAIRAAAIGGREGAEGLRIMQFEIDQTGTASEIAAARTKGLGGSLEALRSSAQTASIAIGGALAPGLEELAEGFTALIEDTEEFITALGRVDRAVDKFLEDIPGGPEGKNFVEEFLAFGLAPGAFIGQGLKFDVRDMFKGEDEAKAKLKDLNDELQALQTARTEAERGAAGPSPIAAELTTRIQALRAEIKELEKVGPGINSGLTTPLTKAISELERLRSIELGPNIGPSTFDAVIDKLEEQAEAAGRATQRINDLPDGITRVGNASTTAADGVDALTRALKGLEAASSAANSELLKLQNEGASPQRLIENLEEQRSLLEQRIANIKSNGNQAGDASAIDALRIEINSVDSQIESLQNEIIADQKEAANKAKAAAAKAEKARKERNEALARLMEAASIPIERLLARAGTTDPLKDDIKFTTQLVQLYKRQIVEATKRLTDVEIRNRVLAALDKKLFDAIQDRKRLQAENRKAIRDAFVEKQERITRGIELDIELADLNENTQRSINLRLKLIARLKKEARVLRLQGNALKENRNERARIRQEIEDIKNDEKKSDPRAAQKFLFEQLQAQQGFAANLLGNLITGPTAGLVGVPAPPTQGIRTESAAAEARATFGPSAGQTNTEINVLEKILTELRKLNGSYDAPEAINNKKTGAATMDSQPM